LATPPGGVVFIALFKYSHVIRRAAEPEKVDLSEASWTIITGVNP